MDHQELTHTIDAIGSFRFHQVSSSGVTDGQSWDSNRQPFSHQTNRSTSSTSHSCLFLSHMEKWNKSVLLRVQQPNSARVQERVKFTDSASCDRYAIESALDDFHGGRAPRQTVSFNTRVPFRMPTCSSSKPRSRPLNVWHLPNKESVLFCPAKTG